MSLLAELFEKLDAPPPEDEAEQPPRDNAPGDCRDTCMLPTHHLVHAPSLSVMSPTEVRRNAWRIILGGCPVCVMVGEPMTEAEALEAARWRWPDAELCADCCSNS